MPARLHLVQTTEWEGREEQSHRFFLVEPSMIEGLRSYASGTPLEQIPSQLRETLTPIVKAHPESLAVSPASARSLHVVQWITAHGRPVLPDAHFSTSLY